MKSIQLKNARLETLLLSTIDLFYAGKAKSLTNDAKERKDNLITEYHPCSEEYLLEAFKHDFKKFGYPRAAHGCPMSDEAERSFDPGLTEISKRLKDIGRLLGTPRNALAISYPDNGYIGWHHNGNAPGHNILFTYSQDGDGEFCYWDHKTQSIQRMQDKPGLNIKVGYYPSEKTEADRLYWHMAHTKKHRVSIAFIINQKEMWQSMIDEITMGEYDHGLLGQGR